MKAIENLKIENLKYNQDGLIPAIAQDAAGGRVLMQAYMNAESLRLTLETGFAHYFSRSRAKLWKKGEESGNLQRVKEVLVDCDGDCILLKVEQVGGVACHTGAETCFFNAIKTFKRVPEAAVLYDGVKTIKERRANPQQGSYTNHLFDKGFDTICKKLGEEAAEVIIAAKNGTPTEIAAESADLLYHLLVLLEAAGTPLEDVFGVLEERRDSERKRSY